MLKRRHKRSSRERRIRLGQTKSEKFGSSCDKARRGRRINWQYCSDPNGQEYRKLVLALLEWLEMEKVGFGLAGIAWNWGLELTEMAWNGGSLFLPDAAGLVWRNSVWPDRTVRIQDWIVAQSNSSHNTHVGVGEQCTPSTSRGLFIEPLSWHSLSYCVKAWVEQTRVARQ
jgi:hypothetical protein